MSLQHLKLVSWYSGQLSDVSSLKNGNLEKELSLRPLLNFFRTLEPCLCRPIPATASQWGENSRGRIAKGFPRSGTSITSNGATKDTEGSRMMNTLL